MKSGKKVSTQKSITKPLLQDLKKREQLEFELRNPSIGSEAIKPASLYQDSGNGYNSDFTFPQE